MREQMEKQRRKREKRTEKMREMRDRGERVKDKILIFFYNTATVQKILQYCYLQFSNARVFEAENVKFSLH